jgi:penicillin-binding protein 1A
MVLGTSDVRLIDMTRAFASVGNKGVAVTPYGITRVTANGAVIYQHEVDTSHVLVAPFVAAQMTDLLQTTVATGTGRAAQIGRPVAGKTGTTTLNKDGWFIGFSSGLTTGVWMGRDDAKVVPGLHGGTAPAVAFHDYMIKAVARRPVEQFDTQVTLPEYQLEPDNEAYGSPDNGVFVDEDGNPVEQPEAGSSGTRPDQGDMPTDDPKLDQDWIDRMTGKPGQPGRGDRQRDPRDLPRQPPVSVPSPDRAPPRDGGTGGGRQE